MNHSSKMYVADHLIEIHRGSRNKKTASCLVVPRVPRAWKSKKVVKVLEGLWNQAKASHVNNSGKMYVADHLIDIHRGSKQKTIIASCLVVARVPRA